MSEPVKFLCLAEKGGKESFVYVLENTPDYPSSILYRYAGFTDLVVRHIVSKLKSLLKLVAGLGILA